MNIRNMNILIGNNILDDEQVSLPFISTLNGKKVVGFFTYESKDVSDELMIINRINREIYIDPETGRMEIRNVNSEETHEITFDTFYDLDTLDAMYENYYDKIDSYLKEEITIEELNEAFDKLCPKSFVNLYKAEGLMQKEMDNVNDSYTDVKEDDSTKIESNGNLERGAN